MPPPHPDQCQNDFAVYGQWKHAPPPAFRNISQEDKEQSSGNERENDQFSQEDRHNLLDIHGIIFFTASSPSAERGAGPPGQRVPAGQPC
jgi:hypothetical protein